MTYVSLCLWVSSTCCAWIAPSQSVGSLVAVPDLLAICSNCEHLAFWQLLEKQKKKWKNVKSSVKFIIRKEEKPNEIIYARTRFVCSGIYILSITDENSPL